MKIKSVNNFVLPILLLIIAYEWIIASVNKLLTKNYLGNMHKQMTDAISGIQIHSYANLFKSIAIPNYHLFGILVLAAELFVGLTFVVIAIRQFQEKTSKMMGIFGFIASIIAAFMNLNYALLGGDTLFVDPANAFQESISIDWILFLVELTFAFYFYPLFTQQTVEQ